MVENGKVYIDVSLYAWSSLKRLCPWGSLRVPELQPSADSTQVLPAWLRGEDSISIDAPQPGTQREVSCWVFRKVNLLHRLVQGLY
jgi:hypothetical protein